MKDQPVLSEGEWNLVTELLRLELEELPNETHHASTLEMRNELRERRKMVESILDRMQMPAAS
jgi:hypothetical protein